MKKLLGYWCDKTWYEDEEGRIHETGMTLTADARSHRFYDVMVDRDQVIETKEGKRG